MPKKTIMAAKSRGGRATATHYRDDDHDYVNIGDLGVLVTHDGDWWFAQGLEIDYTAQGKSLDEVRERFTRGLIATAEAHLTEFGSIVNLLRPSPDVLIELFKASERKLLKMSVESMHDLHLPREAVRPAARRLPFSGIRFFEQIGRPIAAAV